MYRKIRKCNENITKLLHTMFDIYCNLKYHDVIPLFTTKQGNLVNSGKSHCVRLGKRDIEVLRDQLYHLIKGGYSYKEIYKVSTALDQLIISFYNKQLENNHIIM